MISEVSALVGNRPVRISKSLVEIFNADAREQRQLVRNLRPIREKLGKRTLIFHTTAESRRLYKDFLEEWEGHHGGPTPSARGR